MKELSALITEIAQVTGLPVRDIDPDAPFASLGMESLQAVTIAANLSEKLGRDVPVTLFFDYPTARELSSYLSGKSVRADLANSQAFSPVAVVGMACRFPGAESVEKFWYNLNFGVDGIRETPPDRWNWREFEQPALRWGGFLSEIHGFDGKMFGISEPEAEKMDPQQKLLLQTAHEAMESAGLAVQDLQKSRTGVFVGISSSDFSLQKRNSSTVFDATGNAHSIAANRISYVFNLKGPSLSIDTACSSSLVAFHEACKSLNAGECDFALVGGVNVILEPEITKAFSEAGMLSPEGRCKTFSADANGYVRGEGVGVMLLQRAKDAAPERILALVRGTAVNHDGKTNGLTAPNGNAQEDVIRDALRRAALAPEEVQFVEAHGTATSLGDPVEVETLGRIFSAGVTVGSAKAFVGHLEAAAGICGLIKACLAIRYRTWPKQIQFSRLNPKITTKSVKVADQPIHWEATSPKKIGISSFGFGGTNAHVILAEPEEAGAPVATVPHELKILSFSATGTEALKAFGQRWVDALGIDEGRANQLLERSAVERLHYEHRVALWGKSQAEVQEELQHWLDGKKANALEKKGKKGFRPKVAFAFTGQGSQYVGMAESLAKEEAGFRRRWRENLACFESYFPEALTKVKEPQIYQTDYGQCLVFALELALAEFLQEDWGIQAEVAFGHSLGELAAAAFTGALAKEDAFAFVAQRGYAMQYLCKPGAMVSVRGRASELTIPGLEIAAINGKELFVLSGEVEAIEAAKWENAQRLKVDRAFHSKLMDPALSYLRSHLPKECFSPRIPLLSGLTGNFFANEPEYWLKQARQPTQFYSMLQNLDANLVVEIGPQPILSVMGQEALPDVQFVPLLRRNNPEEWKQALAQLTLLGTRKISQRSGPALPLTPFQTESKETPVDNLLGELQTIVGNLLQVEPSTVDPDANLVDLGADSLLLLNAIQIIKDRFDVTLAVPDLFRELNHLRAIETHIQKNRKPKAEPAREVAQMNRVAAAAAPMDVRELIQQQLAIMNQQLALLGGTAPIPTLPANSPVAAVEAKGVLGNWSNRAKATKEEENAYVKGFIERFAKKTKATKDHTQKYRKYLADNRISAGFRPNLKEMIYTIVFKEGKGSRFTDLDGNSYLDFTMGFGVNLFGHSPDFIDQRISEQLKRGYSVGPQAELAGVVAEKACRVLQQERVAFLNSGTEAVMTALRLARTVTGRRKVVIFEGSYHGHADVVLARSAGAKAVPVAPGVPEGIVGDVVVLPYGEEALPYLRENAAQLAAVLVEPVQSRYPEHQPRQFLQEVRKITEATGCAFIFDEVICGLRVKPAGAQEYFGIRPDISCYGKILGGGLPIGAVAGKAKYLDPIDGGHWQFGDDSYPKAEMTFFAGTFCKHPLTLAAADAVLDRFLSGENLDLLNQRTQKLCDRLNALFSGLDLEASCFGSLFRFKSGGNLDLFFANLNYRGIYVWEGRNLFLSTAHSEEDLEEFLKVVRETVEELKGEGLIRKKA